MDPMMLMVAGYGAQGISSLGSAYAQSQAAKMQASFQKQQYDTNARLAEIQGEDAIRRGEIQSNSLAMKAGSAMGASRASMAGQGVDVGSGSAAEVEGSIRAMSDIDQATIRNNAWRQAWGYKVQANDMRGRGQMAEIAGNFSAGQTMLTGGMQFMSAGLKAGYYGYQSRQGGTPGGDDEHTRKAAEELAFWSEGNGVDR